MMRSSQMPTASACARAWTCSPRLSPGTHWAPHAADGARIEGVGGIYGARGFAKSFRVGGSELSARALAPVTTGTALFHL